MDSWFIDSRQVEALCRFEPERKMPNAAVVPVKTRAALGPSLNYDDVPEVGFGSRPKFAGRASRMRAPRALALVLVKSRCQPVMEEDESFGGSTAEPDDAWICTSCTFVNSSACMECAMCEGQQLITEAVPFEHARLPCDDWPTLTEATSAGTVPVGLTADALSQLGSGPACFTIASEADNVSVAASWLHMAETRVEEFEIGSEMLDTESVAESWVHADDASMASWCEVTGPEASDLSSAAPASTSWAALASATLPAVPKRAAKRVQPLTQSRTVKAVTDEDDNCDEDRDCRNRCGSRAHRRS